MKEHEHPYWLQHTAKYTDKKTGNITGGSGGDLGKGTYSRLDSAKRKAEQHAGQKLDWEKSKEGHHKANAETKADDELVHREFLIKKQKPVYRVVRIKQP